MSEAVVSFTQMKDGTKADYELLAKLEENFVEGLPDRIMGSFDRLQTSFPGYRITRLQHCLMSATRAAEDGADVDWVVSALLHDIGDDLAPHNHDSYAAVILKPYVREQCSWVVQHHGIFQMIYYAHHYGDDPNARDKYRDHPYYQDAIDFCERWDQASFDPDFPHASLESFEPMVRDVFSRPAWSDAVLRPGAREPLCHKAES